MYNVLSSGLKNDMIASVAVMQDVDGLVGKHMYTVLNACTTNNGECKADTDEESLGPGWRMEWAI